LLLSKGNIETESFYHNNTIMKNQTKLIVGLLAGAAAVAAVGLLISTDKGNEIKEEVTDYLADIIKSVRSKAMDTASNLNTLKDNAINTARSAVKSKVDQAAEAVGN
jgi:gas vesicle protein